MPAIGHRIVRLARSQSTQLDARQLIEAGAPHGVVVVAARQDAGRGRLGRTWSEPACGLFTSIVLRPRTPARLASRITLAACVALTEALAALGVNARVKWPNDVVIAATIAGRLGPWRKVAGILVEVVRLDLVLESALLGIGVNIAAPDGGFAADIADTAGALRDAGFAGDAEDVLTALLPHLETRLAALDDDAFAVCVALLRARSSVLGTRVRVAEDPPLVGTALDLDRDGALLVQTDDGQVHRVVAGDVWPAHPSAVLGRVSLADT